MMITRSVSWAGVRVDPVTQTVRAQGGALWGDVDHESQAFGLATPGGVVSTAGIGGLTLGGGSQTWLIRKYGSSADNLVSADVVTANGDFLTASERENESIHGQRVVIIAACYAATAQAGETVVAPIRALKPAVDMLASVPHTGLQSMFDPLFSKGIYSYAKSDYFDDIPPSDGGRHD